MARFDSLLRDAERLGHDRTVPRVMLRSMIRRLVDALTEVRDIAQREAVTQGFEQEHEVYENRLLTDEEKQNG